MELKGLTVYISSSLISRLILTNYNFTYPQLLLIEVHEKIVCIYIDMLIS